MTRLRCLLLLCAVVPYATAADFIREGARFRADTEQRSGKVAGVTAPATWQHGVYNGVTYNIHADGSGGTAHWMRTCQQDMMIDARSCFVHSGDLWITVGANGVRHISIGAEHFPRSTVALRVDDRPARVALANGWAGAKARTMVADMLAGKVLKTRYWRWPYRIDIDGEVDAAGLKEALEIAQWAVNH